MQPATFLLGTQYIIVCKAQDLALRIDETDPTKYQKSRVVGDKPNHQNLHQLWCVWNTNGKQDGHEIRNEYSSFVFDEESGEIRLKVAKQNSDQLFSITKAPVQAFYEYFWIKTSSKGDKALSLEGILRYKNFNPNDETQLFRFELVNDNQIVNKTSVIVNNYSGKSVDVPGFSRKMGDRLIQYTKNKGFNQRWTLIKQGKGYIIRSLFNGHLIDISEGKYKRGQQIIQWQHHGGENQVWIPDPVGNGTYKFRSAGSSNFMLSVKNKSVDNQAYLQLTDQDNQASIWTIQGAQL